MKRIYRWLSIGGFFVSGEGVREGKKKNGSSVCILVVRGSI